MFFETQCRCNMWQLSFHYSHLSHPRTATVCHCPYCMFLAPPLMNVICNTAYTLVDNTGCRAPFWRQLKGDIAYIEAVLHDSPDVVYITASTHGYFVNGVSTVHSYPAYDQVVPIRRYYAINDYAIKTIHINIYNGC